MRKFLVVALGSLIIWGCQPKPASSDLLNNLVVFTDHDTSVNFGSYKNFFLVLDTMAYVYNRDTSVFVDTPGSGKFVDAVTRRVNDKLIAAGYTRQDTLKKADLHAYVYIVESYNVAQSLSYSPYGYGYGYGGYYGSYYPTISVSDEAEFFIVITDQKKFSGGVPATIWYAVVSDWVSAPEQQTQTLQAIDQAFQQSSYIKK